jgi:RNA polymerase sigma factor (sigma-70 family)
MNDQRALVELVEGARNQDQVAWQDLVARLDGLVRSVTRGFGLRHDDAADVSQTVWLALYRSVHGISDPERVGLWLATTTRRECRRVIGRGKANGTNGAHRELDVLAVADPAVGPEDMVVWHEQARLLRQAVAALPARCRSLVTMLLVEPPASYDEIAAALDMSVNSVGPTRRRCLESLRDSMRQVAAGHDVSATGRRGPSSGACCEGCTKAAPLALSSRRPKTSRQRR